MKIHLGKRFCLWVIANKESCERRIKHQLLHLTNDLASGLEVQSPF